MKLSGDRAIAPIPPRPSDVPLPCFDEARQLVRSLGVVDALVVEAILRVVRISCRKLDIGVDCYAFGSVGSGLSTAQSDIDLVIDAGFEEPTEQREKKEVAGRALNKLLPLLENDGFLVIERVWTSRVPVLKLLAPTDIEVDISYNNMDARKNTLLIGQYIKLDSPNIGGLIRLVKQWAKAKGVCGASMGHLSSYAWTLAALFYLQIEHRLPNLQVEVDLKEWADNTLYTLGLEKLFHNFFVFYADNFQWGAEVASIRCGKRVRWNKSEELNETLRQWTRPVLDIEDPYDRCGGTQHSKRRNLSVVLTKEEDIDRVRDEIVAAKFTKTLGDLMKVEREAEMRCAKCFAPQVLAAGGYKWCKKCWRTYLSSEPTMHPIPRGAERQGPPLSQPHAQQVRPQQPPQPPQQSPPQQQLQEPQTQRLREPQEQDNEEEYECVTAPHWLRNGRDANVSENLHGARHCAAPSRDTPTSYTSQQMERTQDTLKNLFGESGLPVTNSSNEERRVPVPFQ
eukprot:GEMP01028347.1.p1 GENE.GEMP01028347.1~~GEMP01028347.1.p1  ORF type:complete len:510 (-),score=104.03 GEMP01028347.1:724-2253(-)